MPVIMNDVIDIDPNATDVADDLFHDLQKDRWHQRNTEGETVASVESFVSAQSVPLLALVIELNLEIGVCQVNCSELLSAGGLRQQLFLAW